MAVIRRSERCVCGAGELATYIIMNVWHPHREHKGIWSDPVELCLMCGCQNTCNVRAMPAPPLTLAGLLVARIERIGVPAITIMQAKLSPKTITVTVVL
jgi:hypothetical protein